MANVALLQGKKVLVTGAARGLGRISLKPLLRQALKL